MVNSMQSTTPIKRYKSRYADEKQSELYTKFPTNNFLGNEKNVDHVLRWNTFFRRNLHRVAIDYFGLKLHIYQVLILYLMGICKSMVIVAARSAAKSFIIAIYACCVCVVYPYSQVVLTSATKKQAKLIVSEKIRNLQNQSSVLQKEIYKIKDNQNEVIVYFRSGSTITVVPANENGRGYRSNFAIREEFRQIKKNIEDSIIAPFQVIRQAPYIVDPYYSEMPVGVCTQDSVDVYISSSWLDPHWMWTVVDNAYDSMIDGTGQFLLAFDESIVLKHKIKSQAYFQKEKKKQDILTWRCEFMNERIKENLSAYFTSQMFFQNQNILRPFYPISEYNYLDLRKNPYDIPKQPGEVRIISCDLAFISSDKNDNSIFTCMRLLPDYTRVNRSDGEFVMSNGYRRVVPYIESMQGCELAKQAVRIRQLFNDFGADYIVLDTRNAGVGVYDCLARELYDDDRNVYYNPLKSMNSEKYADRIIVEGAEACIFTIDATPTINSEAAKQLRKALDEQRVDLLIGYERAKEETLPKIKEYVSTPDADEQIFYEMPFLETQMLISETTLLIREKHETLIVVHEQGTNRKDRYTSFSYGNYFASLLELDLFATVDDYEYGVYIN